MLKSLILVTIVNIGIKIGVFEVAELIPRVDFGLNLHVLMSAFQAGWIWGNSVSQEKCPGPQQFDLKIFQNVLCIKWTNNDNLGLDKSFNKLTKTICECSADSYHRKWYHETCLLELVQVFKNMCCATIKVKTT